ncbi:hypothetical protein [Arenivirga flava]|uniref:Uncharacterized protein n=1 Tax=Arenivirga flava TaxID=1930060 RepID=A0AA37XDK9_9MICO|nr:hypothetical protein [Arenivirga flava]GMA26796.1 hypothetical protein GCM10025874_00490 [Arenivirga flava]GMA29912.1 hypothetical protein GCM10025874_31650 [Arenivirga flava]
MSQAPFTFELVEERKVPGSEAWTLHNENGDMLGKIERRRIGRGHTIFWMAYGVHPDDGRMIPLELSADREERVRKVLEFRADPKRFRHHFGWG